MDLMRKKPVAQDGRSEELRRELGGLQLVLLGVGCTVGAGIFVVTGTTAALHAGPGIVFSFLLSGFGCLCAGLCYAEFASMIPEAGSAYSYAYATIGEFVAWIIGWDLILEYLFGAATVAVGWSGYVASFLSGIGLALPSHLCNGPIKFTEGRWQLTGDVLNVPALLIIVALTMILILGIRESAWVNAAIVFLKVTVIVLFIVACFPHVNPQNWTPFVPPNTGKFDAFGWTGVLAAAGIIFYAYIGFDAVSTAAQETKKPERDMPIGILGSLLICTILYILVSLVLTGVVSYKELNVPAPVAFAVERVGPSVAWIRPWIELGAIAGLSSVILVLLLGQPRIFYRMAADGLLPPIFARIHSKFRTPYVTTALTGLIAALLASLFRIEVLSSLVSIGTLLAFVIVCISVWVLRRTRPELPRRFRTPWVPLVPILGALVCAGQMVFLSLETWVRLLVWLIVGLLVYFGYSRQHSRIRQGNRQV